MVLHVVLQAWLTSFFMAVCLSPGSPHTASGELLGLSSGMSQFTRVLCASGSGQFVDFCQTVSWCVLPVSPYCTGHEVNRQV